MSDIYIFCWVICLLFVLGIGLCFGMLYATKCLEKEYLKVGKKLADIYAEVEKTRDNIVDLIKILQSVIKKEK